MRAGMIVSAVAICLLAACAVSSPELPPPPAIGSPDRPGVSAETSDSAESAMPEVITEDLAREILTELEAQVAVFIRWVIASDVGEQPPSSIRASLEAAYLPVLVQPLIDRFVGEHENLGGEHPYVVEPFGQYYPDRLTVLRSDPDCPLLQVTWDATTVEKPNGPAPRGEEVVALLPSGSIGWVYNSIFDLGETSWDDVELELERRNLC